MDFEAASVTSAVGKGLLCTGSWQAQVVLQQVSQGDMAFEEGGSLGICVVLLYCLFKTFIIFWLFPLAGQARPVRQACIVHSNSPGDSARQLDLRS